MSTGQPAWQELVRGGGGLAGSSASFDANGPYIRLYAGAGETSFTTQLPGVGDLVGPAELPVVGARPADPADALPAAPPRRCVRDPAGQQLAAETDFSAPSQNAPVPAGATAPDFEELQDASEKLYDAGSTTRLARQLDSQLRRIGEGGLNGEAAP